MNTPAIKSRNIEAIRFISMIIAAALLNIGLYFILYFITPLVTGIMCGVVFRNLRKGVLVGYIGSMAAYFPLFIFLELITTVTGIDIPVILAAALLISFLGGIGGFLGYLLVRKKDV